MVSGELLIFDIRMLFNCTLIILYNVGNSINFRQFYIKG